MTNKIISSNIDAKNRVVSNVVNRRYNRSALDDIRSRLSRIKESETYKSAIEDGQLAGVLLWERTFTFLEFKAKYENNISFFREVTNKGESSGDFVREAYVHIPEMTLMLPYPDFSIISEYLNALAALNEPGSGADAKSDSFLDISEKCEKEFKKIIMYPKFYQVVSSVISPLNASYNSVCLVRSLNKNGLMTESVGKYIKTIVNESV